MAQFWPMPPPGERESAAARTLARASDAAIAQILRQMDRAGHACKRAVGIIPARYGSTRFPGKPLAELLGKPMIEHTFRAAKAAKMLSKVVVTSDSDRVLEVIHKIGGDTVRTGACRTGTDRIVQALESMGSSEIATYDVVVNVQGDEPGVDPQHIDLCVQRLREDPEVVMSTLATPIHCARDATDRNIVKCVTDVQSNALYFSRAMIPHSKTGVFDPQAPTPWLRHIGLYAFRTAFLLQFPALPRCALEHIEDLEQLRVLHAGYKIKVVQVETTIPGVDTTGDLRAVRELLGDRQQRASVYPEPTQ